MSRMFSCPTLNHQRDYARMRVDLRARVLFEGREITLRATDCSPNAAYLEGEELLSLGERLVVYIDSIGRVDAKVGRVEDKGMSVLFSVSENRRQRIADRLTILTHDAKRAATPMQSRRSVAKLHVITRKNGMRQACMLVDVSTRGVSVVTSPRLFYDESVEINGVSARVAHTGGNATSLYFQDHASPDAFKNAS